MIIQLNALVSAEIPDPAPGTDLHVERYAMALVGAPCNNADECEAVADEIDRVDAVFDAREVAA